MTDLWSQDPREALRPDENFDLATFDRRSTPGWDGKKKDAKKYIAEHEDLLDELQERLFADGRNGGTKRILVVVQGLDTAGKGGIARHVFGLFDPQGIQLRSFGVPTEEELSHHYLWRIEKALPDAGRIGLFDRSHYEDVLVVRVDELVPEEEWRGRYEEINEWERKLVDDGTVVLKFALMPSREEQAIRLMERLDRPDKRWKYNPSDVDTRQKWDDYQEAYMDVFRYTNTEHAPWLVLPADRKWFARLVVTEVLLRTLVDMNIAWPKPDGTWTPKEERERLAADMSVDAFRESFDDTAAVVTKAIETSLEVFEETAMMRAPNTKKAEKKVDKKVTRRREKLYEDLAETLAHKTEIMERMSASTAG